MALGDMVTNTVQRADETSPKFTHKTEHPGPSVDSKVTARRRLQARTQSTVNPDPVSQPMHNVAGQAKLRTET